MIRCRHDTPPEVLKDKPACRIFGEPVLCVFPVGQTVRLPMWYAENSRRIEINCSDMPTALAFIEKICDGELDELEAHWRQCPYE